MRMVLESAFDRYSGYGNDAVDLAIHLDKQGVDLTVLPTSLLPGLPRAFTRLLEKHPTGRKDVLLRFAAPPACDSRVHALEVPKQVAYTMWERTPLTKQDTQPLAGWDLVLVTCQMNVDAFRPMVPEPTPIKVVPCGIEVGDWPPADRPVDDRLAFLMIGMLGGRKDPFALLDTWRDLKRDRPDFDATLTLHTLAKGGLHPGLSDVYPDVKVTSQPLDRDALLAMYHRHHVLVSTSRGEGNNKPAMEFLATGGSVVATDWAGHQNWLHPSIAYPVPGALVPARGRPEAREFAVDRSALRDTLLSCWEDRDLLRRKQRAAPRVIASSLSWEKVTGDLIRRITQVL